MTVLDKRFITVVSGLPRSGTSMMMRMLESGGLPVLTDNLRKADDDNPYGYYEFEPVKQLKKANYWLADAYGKVVKMVYLLLYDLPKNHDYKIIFMRRKLEEVIASQNTMLRRQGNKGSPITDEQVAKVFGEHLQALEAWLGVRKNFPTLFVNYNELLVDSERVISDISRFIGYELDVEAMVRVIDPSLYRQRL